MNRRPLSIHPDNERFVLPAVSNFFRNTPFGSTSARTGAFSTPSAPFSPRKHSNSGDIYPNAVPANLSDDFHPSRLGTNVSMDLFAGLKQNT